MSDAWALRAMAIREQVSMADVFTMVDCDAGRGGVMRCPNPAHTDAHPSAKFYADSDKVHCFTCGQTWDVIGIVMLRHGLSFPDAITAIEQAFGLAEATDASLVGAVLRRHGHVDCSQLLELTERRVLSSRGRCALPQYARLWRAYDTARVQYGARQIDEATLIAALDRIAALCPPVEPAPAFKHP